MSATPIWYARRLTQMSFTEAATRAGDHSRRLAWRARQVRPGDPLGPPPHANRERSFVAVLPHAARESVPEAAMRQVIAAAESILNGNWTILGTARPDIADPDWFYDPVTARRAPASKFAFGINHRDERETGNVKAIWELSRHHHLTVLASAFWLTRDERYAVPVATQLRSWWRSNPFLSGIHWTSGIEQAERLLSWVWIRRLLNEWGGVADLFEHDNEALRQIWWHHRYLAAFPSRGSSANNHLVAEAAGQTVAACAFPWFEESAAWQREAIGRLEDAFAANTSPDGVNRELASDYHRFVTELVLLAAVDAEAAGTPLGESTRNRLAACMDAAAALVDVRCHHPRQGDGDDGRTLVVDGPGANPWSLLLGAGAATVGMRDWWPLTEGSVFASAVSGLAGSSDSPSISRDRRPEGGPDLRPDHFPDAGITLLRTPAGTSPELWCRCDGGPHGFLSIAAHAHADALSLEFRHDGVDVLADPGTYCYHGEPEWRAYFRSTTAHNTVVIDDTDQSVSGGPFMWTTRSDATGVRVHGISGEGDVSTWRAVHRGYRRLDSDFAHERYVSLDPTNGVLDIQDRLTSRDRHVIRLMFHLGPAVDVQLRGSTARLSWTDAASARVRAVLQLPSSLRWSQHRGEQAPILGWYSPSFGVRIPSTTLVGSGVLHGRSSLFTSLGLQPQIKAETVGGAAASRSLSALDTR